MDNVQKQNPSSKTWMKSASGCQLPNSNIYATTATNSLRRPFGLGVMGLQNALCKRGLMVSINTAREYFAKEKTPARSTPCSMKGLARHASN